MLRLEGEALARLGGAARRLPSSDQSSRKRAKSSSRRVRSSASTDSMPATRGSITSQSWISPRTPCSSLAAPRMASASGPEAAGGDLEHVAEPFGGDPHVVLGRFPAGLERLLGEAGQLLEPGRDDPRRVGAQRARRVEARDLAGLHRRAASDQLARAAPAAPPAAPPRRRGRGRRWPGAARRAAWRSGSRAGRGRPPAPAAANSRRKPIATSRSRRSPSASASAFSGFIARR